MKRIGIVVNELINFADLAGGARKITHQRLYVMDTAGNFPTAFQTLRTDLGVHGGVGDMLPIANDADVGGPGWLIGIESDFKPSPDHQVTYVYKANLDGSISRQPGIDVTLKITGAHSTNPVLVPDVVASGWLVLVVCDSKGPFGGPLTHHINPAVNAASQTAKVVPGTFLIEVNLQIAAATDGRFAALWHTRLGIDGDPFRQLQPRFVVFKKATSAAVAPLLDIRLESPILADDLGDGGHFTTRLLRVGNKWAALYPTLPGPTMTLATIDDAGVVTKQPGLCPIADAAAVSADTMGAVVGIGNAVRVAGGIQIQFRTVTP